MSNKQTAAWRHPVHTAMVILPDGYTMTIPQARKAGHEIIEWPADETKLATPHPHATDKVVIARGVAVDKQRAVEAGFTVAADVKREAPQADWRASIINSPEAKGRDSAVAELLVKHSPETLSAEAARGFLRGLPIEQSEQKAPKMTKTNDDPRAARIAEISASMSSFNRDRGFTAKPKLVAAKAALSNVEPVKLKRLAEIRLSMLESGQTHATRGEANNLRYALEVHETTGAPLANVFAQMGIDTSSFAR